MPLLSTTDQDRLRQDFAALTRPVRLVFFTRSVECETCLQARAILDELPSLSDTVTIEEVDLLLEPKRAAAYGIDRVPAIAIVTVDALGMESDTHMRFLGTPSGYEFVSLIRAVLLAGGGPSQLSAANRARVAAVDQPMTLHVFSTPTCPHCPRAVTLAHEMAFVNPHITAYAVEATEYPDLARRYHVTGVPKTVVVSRADKRGVDGRVDHQVEILGALPEDDFIEQALGLPSRPVNHP